MSVKLLTEHHLEFLSLKGGYTGSSESTHAKMPHCLKSHATAQIISVPSDPPVLTVGDIIATEETDLDIWQR